MKGDFHVRFCGKARVQFPCLTRLQASLKNDRTPKKQTSEKRTLTFFDKNLRTDFGDTQSDPIVLKIFPTAHLKK